MKNVILLAMHRSGCVSAGTCRENWKSVYRQFRAEARAMRHVEKQLIAFRGFGCKEVAISSSGVIRVVNMMIRMSLLCVRSTALSSSRFADNRPTSVWNALLFQLTSWARLAGGREPSLADQCPSVTNS